MLNLTRIHNANTSVSYMRRIIALANDYAARRTAFGKKLTEHPLHMLTLGKLNKAFRGNLLMLLENVSLLQKIDKGVRGDTWDIFRL